MLVNLALYFRRNADSGEQLQVNDNYLYVFFTTSCEFSNMVMKLGH